MPVLIPVLIVGGAVGIGVWWWMRKREPPPPTIGIGTGGGTVGITIGGGQVSGGTGVTLPNLSAKPVDPPVKSAVEPPTPIPGASAELPSSAIAPGSYYWPVNGDTGTAIVGKAYGLPNDASGRRFRNWEMLRSHPRNQGLKGSSQSVWDGALEKRHKAPGQHPRGSGTRHPVIWIPPMSEVVG